MKQLSKQMTVEEWASTWAHDKETRDYILKNERDEVRYHNNGKSSFVCLSYPIYDGDYYFAFIGDSVRVNAKYNAQANRELRKLAESSLSNDDLFNRMQDYFEMQFKNVGSGDSMTREELWFAILDIRDVSVCDACGVQG